MNLKVIVAISVIVATPAFAQGQMGSASPKGPKLTTADVQKVVKVIRGDQVKTKLYCDLAKLNDQAAAADEKKDTKKVEMLSKQIDATEQKLGAEYLKLMESMQQIDTSSKEGEDLLAMFQPLDDLCAKN
jgi:mannose/fructose/N-acetylgalactosamine-specific phosphotransferase system component IIB